MIGRGIRIALPPVLLGLVVTGAWELAVKVFGIKPFVLPSPSAIATQFHKHLGNIAKGALGTGRNALIGMLVGTLLAVFAAILSSLVRLAADMSAPVVAALSVVPIVALAPVLYTMFGADKQTARWLVAAIAVYVPVYLNSLKGLRRARPIHRDLFRVNAASGWQITRHLTIPGALPYVATGIKIATALSVITALIAEYFGGPVGGLGKAITSSAASSNYPLAWAYVLGSVLLGMVAYLCGAAIERLASPRGAG